LPFIIFGWSQVRRLNPKLPLPLQDRIAIFLELAAIHAKLNHLPEATKVR
jgi:hypothetical protein